MPPSSIPPLAPPSSVACGLPGCRRTFLVLTEEAATGDRVICEAKRIWSHYFLLDLGKASRALHHGPVNWPGLSLHYQSCDYAHLPNRLPCRAPAHGLASRRRTADPQGNTQGKTLILNPRPLGAPKPQHRRVTPATFMMRPRPGVALPTRLPGPAVSIGVPCRGSLGYEVFQQPASLSG
jgi:hypothetical protein